MNKTDRYSEEAVHILIEGIKNNCHKSQLLFIKNYSGIINKRIGEKFSQANDVKILFNECLLKIFLNIHKYDSDKGKLSSWVGTVCTNTCIDHIRNNNKKRDTYLLLLEDVFPGYSEDVLGNISEEETVDLGAKVLNMMSVLKPREAELLQLKYFEGLSFEEISDKMNIGNQNARTIVFRAKEKLKGML